MKRDEIKKWREVTIQEIEEKLKEFSSKLYSLKHQVRMGQQKDSSTIRKLRRDAARLKTIAREKTLDKK